MIVGYEGEREECLTEGEDGGIRKVSKAV